MERRARAGRGLRHGSGPARHRLRGVLLLPGPQRRPDPGLLSRLRGFPAGRGANGPHRHDHRRGGGVRSAPDGPHEGEGRRRPPLAADHPRGSVPRPAGDALRRAGRSGGPGGRRGGADSGGGGLRPGLPAAGGRLRRRAGQRGGPLR